MTPSMPDQDLRASTFSLALLLFISIIVFCRQHLMPIIKYIMHSSDIHVVPKVWNGSIFHQISSFSVNLHFAEQAGIHHDINLIH